MKNKIFIGLFLCLCFQVTNSWAQSPVLPEDNFSSELTDNQRFSNYIDSAYQYLYRDPEIFNQSVEACLNLLDQGIPLADSLKMKITLVRIYGCYAKDDPLCAFQVIVNNKYLIESKSVIPQRIRGFKYLESYTYMVLGDYEAAQKASYEGVAKSKEEQDTVSIINNLSALGQLFTLSGDYDEALKYARETLTYLNGSIVSPSNVVLVYEDISSIHFELKEYEQAKSYLMKALDDIHKYKLNGLKTNVYSQLGKIYLAVNQIDSAEYYLKLLKDLPDVDDGEVTVNSTQSLEAKLFKTKGMYPEAIANYKEIIARLDSSSVDDLLSYYENIHEIYALTNQGGMAYDYLLKHQALKAQIDKDEKRQKTNYLKIKYEIDEKVKDNAILKAELYKGKAKSNLLYGGLAITFVLLFALFAALLQKAKYSKILEHTVSERTENLKESNEQLNTTNVELAELNRILSHDLKEPLRSIVGFSELAGRELGTSEKAKEYFSHVIRSGKQLSQLIEDVIFLRESGSVTSEYCTFKVKPLLSRVTKILEENYSHKNIDLTYQGSESIVGPEKVMYSIFKCLIDNSIKFNEHEKVQINIIFDSDNNNQYFKIIDNGIGIPAEYLDHIFGLFKRLNTRDKYHGSGLGLSITKKMIEKLGGTISVKESEMGKGTTFSLSFPKK